MTVLRRKAGASVVSLAAITMAAIALPAPASAAALPPAMPRLVTSQAQAIVVLESDGETTVYNADGHPSWTSPHGGMIWPVRGRATSEFGPRGGRLHKGIDIAADTGTPIMAAQAGRVVFCGWLGGYGQMIDVDHGDGLVTRYAHLSATLVCEGDRVAQGQPIAKVGMTGSSTGPHLHFEVRVNDEPCDPRTALSPADSRIARHGRDM